MRPGHPAQRTEQLLVTERTANESGEWEMESGEWAEGGWHQAGPGQDLVVRVLGGLHAAHADEREPAFRQREHLCQQLRERTSGRRRLAPQPLGSAPPLTAD